MTKKRIISLFSFCLLAFYSQAQNPSTQPSTQPSSIGLDSLISETDTIPIMTDSVEVDILGDSTTIDSTQLDTIGTPLNPSQFGKRPPRSQKKKSKPVIGNEVYYFYADKPEEIYQFIDTTINSAFFQYDPARSGERDYASLGSPGTALLPLSFEWQDKFGNRAGVHEAFTPYIRKESETKFYTKSKAFSDFYYSQGSEQNDHYFHGDFGRSFDNGIKLSVTHNRLIHSLNNPDLELNSNAFFPYAATRNTSLLTGLAFQKPGSKYQGFLTYAHNEINQLYNGGLLSTDSTQTAQVLEDIIENAADLDANLSIPSNINIGDANLRYRLRTVALTQFFTLAGANEKNTETKRIFNIQHKTKFIRDIYRFADTRFNANYYGIFATDDRGIRVVQNQTIVENYFGLSTLKIENGKAVPSPLGDIRVGLFHQHVEFEGEGYEARFNNLAVEGSWKFSPFSQINIDAFGQIGILDNIGDFRFSASTAFDFKKWGTLQALLRQQRFSPDQLKQQNFSAQVELWNNNFDKSFHSELGFKYLLPSQKLEAGLSYFLLDNHVFYNESFQPEQREGAINLVQLYIKKNLKWNVFHLENLIMFQTSDDDAITLPNWWSRHSLFAQRRIFKNIMLARFGLDLRLSDSYFANNFNPALGQFHLQSSQEVTIYPALDAHFGFVIETFRTFIKLENVSSVLTDEVFYQVPFHPQKELAFRFGISWRFLDKNSNTRSSDSNRGGNQSSGSPINIPNF